MTAIKHDNPGAGSSYVAFQGSEASEVMDNIADMAKLFSQAHRHSRDAQYLLRANDAILKDLGVTRVKANGNSYLFSHRSN